MHKIFSLFLLFFISLSALGQHLNDLSFGTDSTLDVITWNIEWFPKNGQITIDSVSTVIQALDADIIALQEIGDTTLFNQMMDNIDGFDGYILPNWNEGLAYVYKTATIQNPQFYTIYNSSNYWIPFPRYPLLMECTFNNESFVLINNHLKCCGNGYIDDFDPEDEEVRRQNASNLLKVYIDNNHPNDNVILLGDLNDLLTDDPNNNVFQNFFDDADNFRFVDMDIAEGNSFNWSYPSWPSHLDHILISNELFDEFMQADSEVETIKIDDYMDGGFWAYEEDISDHRPVGLKLKNTENTVDINATPLPKSKLHIFPNPSGIVSNFTLENPWKNAQVLIYNVMGETVSKLDISGKHSVSYPTQSLPNGTYYVSYCVDNQIVSTQKLLVVH